jgi:dTDP-alpha-D-glucuronic acid decarboxylase
VVSRTIHRALHGLAPEIYDGGTQTRCFTYVDDAIRGTVLAATAAAAEGEHFNIGSHRETTIAEVVGIICELAGITSPAAPVDTATAWGSSYEDILRRVPDTSKARELLGWEATTPLREGLARTIEWARSNPWWLEDLRDEAAPARAPEAAR